MAETLTPEHRSFIERCRVAHLSTVDGRGEPYIVPVCYALDGDRIVIPIDEKPKRRDRPLKRVRNIQETGRAALVFDHYEEDWSRLAWLMLRGQAALLAPGDAGHERAVERLRQRYQQYRSMRLETADLIVISPERVTSWGTLSDG